MDRDTPGSTAEAHLHPVDSERAGYAKILRVLVPMFIACTMAGCTSVYGLRVPLGEGSQSALVATSDIVIDDKRPAAERKVHIAVGMDSCERWYGDETFVPGKVEYLKRSLAERVRQGAVVRLRMQRFDTVENCQNTANRLEAGAAGAGRTVIYIGGRRGYDDPTLIVRVAGTINGVPFDISRKASYAGVEFKAFPTTNPVYVARIRSAMDEIAAELAAGVRAGTSAHRPE